MRKNEGRISIQVGNIFSQLGKNLAILQILQGALTPTHTHIRV